MYPFEFDYLWALGRDATDGMTAAELAEYVSRPIHAYERDGRAVSNSLRGLVRRGFIVGTGKPLVYRPTERGREILDG